jgi:hypothetical protein
LKKLILDTYREAVRLIDMPGDLREALKAHERLPKFFLNLEREIARLPLKFQTRATIEMLVYDLTKVFVRNVQASAQSRMLSDAAKAEISRQQDKLKRFKEAAETGIITEEVLEDG